MNKPLQVVSSADFLKASAALPKEIRAKLNKATGTLFADSYSLGAHLEKIQSGNDDIYSLRVDDCYRIILKYPDKCNAVFLLYVDRHDDAYDWAKKHCVSINPTTGGIQTTVALAPKVIRKDGHATINAKLSVLSDDNMRTLKIPAQYWEQLRTKILTPNHLIGYKNILSYETYSTLEEMVNGLPVDEAMALYEAISETVDVEPLKPTDQIPGLFDKFTNEELLSLGVPQQFLDLVRTIKIDKELVHLANVLPEDAIQSLYALNNGESVESIKKLTYSDSKSVDFNDYEAALNNPITKTQFATIEDEETMRAMLEYPADQWRAYLHPSQRRMIERHYGGPARIIGGAGTGKTVVIVHRAKYLTHFCETGEKVFVTSYNKSLVADIEKRLSTICNEDELSKIEVSTVDKKTYEITRRLGYSLKYESELKEIWEYAVLHSGIGNKFDTRFISDEWTEVIQAQQIKTREEYNKASRTGRGKPLDQASRESLWKVFEAYMQRCNAIHNIDSSWAQNLCAEECIRHPEQYNYHSILVDECQDLRAPAYRMLRALAGPQRQDDIFFSGDSRQRIYKGNASLSQCGIAINNRSTTLKLNYRTTAEIYEAAMKIQKEFQYDDLDGSTVDHDLCTCIFHGEKPVIKSFDSDDFEWQAVVEDIRRKLQSGIPSQDICILVRHNQKAMSCANKLSMFGITSLMLTNKQNDDQQIPGVRVATMHRVKGMEYGYVYIPFLKVDYMPPKSDLDKCEDENMRHELLQKEANLLSVAMTRAKRYLWLSYTGIPTRYVEQIKA